jgi:hypothetical protein
MIQVIRFGGSRYRFLSKKLLITCSENIGIEWLQMNCRRVCGQRVLWDVFDPQKQQQKQTIKDLRDNAPDAQKLVEFKKENILIGKHLPIQLSKEEMEILKIKEDKLDDEKKEAMQNVEKNYACQIRYWHGNLKEINTPSIKTKIKNRCGYVSGLKWLQHKKLQRPDHFESFSQIIMQKLANSLDLSNDHLASWVDYNKEEKNDDGGDDSTIVPHDDDEQKKETTDILIKRAAKDSVELNAAKPIEELNTQLADDELVLEKKTLGGVVKRKKRRRPILKVSGKKSDNNNDNDEDNNNDDIDMNDL